MGVDVEVDAVEHDPSPARGARSRVRLAHAAQGQQVTRVLGDRAGRRRRAHRMSPAPLTVASDRPQPRRAWYASTARVSGNDTRKNRIPATT
ncbi:Uncharacterised protein [Mycobacteroides abscessus]|nr:Uncharacterised protein [Mycobacteroides abscessus]